MKKILLLLLLATFSIQAQTLQNPTYGNVKLKNNTTDNSATKVNVQSTDGTINTISKSDLVNVVEVNDVPSLPLVGEVGKIYVVKNVNKIYRWNGTFYQGLAGSNLTYQSIIDALTFTPENVANKVTSIGSSANDTNYPSELAVKTHADNLVVGMLNDRGAWDASVNVFPATGGSGVGGAIRKGDMWYVLVAGTLGTKLVNVGDSFRALVNAPSQVATDWSTLEANIGYVPANDNAVVHLAGAETITGQKTFSPTISASGAIARGTYLTPSLTATANNDVLVGLDINTTFTNGAFTGTKSLPVRVTSNQYIGMNVSRNSTGGSAITISNNNGGYNFGVGSINEFFIQRAGGNIVNTIFSTGNSIIQNGGTFTDDLTNRLQVTGTVSSGTTALGNTPPTANNQLTRKDYVDTGLALKANLASPSLTGTPTAPTATAGTNTTQIATTAFVAGGLATKENTFSKNTAFNKNFGTIAGTVAEGNDSRINNGQTAFGWGNHSGMYLPLTATASNSTLWGGLDADFTGPGSSLNLMIGRESISGTAKSYTSAAVKSWLGLGSNAYTSTAYLPLSGGTLNGNLIITGALNGITFDNPIGQSSGIIQSSSGSPVWNINKGAGDSSENYNIYNFTRGKIDFSISNSNGGITASPATLDTQLATLGQVKGTRPYKVYTALFSQNSTSNPTVVILENTLGTVTFTRSSNGVYLVNSSGLFTADKTFVIMGAGTNAAYTNAINLMNSSTFSIVTKVSSTGSDADSANTKVAFEIRVYL